MERKCPTQDDVCNDVLDAVRSACGPGVEDLAKVRSSWLIFRGSVFMRTFFNRDLSLFVTHVGVACVLGVFCGGLYFKTGDTIAGFQSRVGCLFFLVSLRHNESIPF